MISTVARNLKGSKSSEYEDLDANYNSRSAQDVIEMQSQVPVVPDGKYNFFTDIGWAQFL